MGNAKWKQSKQGIQIQDILNVYQKSKMRNLKVMKNMNL